MSWEKKVAFILKSLDDVVEIATKTAVNDIYGDMQDRIFNRGIAKDFQPIGKYSESYKKVRKKKGYQTSFVDLTFSTNLKNSITRQEDKIYFKNDYGTKVSKYNETRFKKRIFAPSADEKQIYIDTLEKELNKLWK